MIILILERCFLKFTVWNSLLKYFFQTFILSNKPNKVLMILKQQQKQNNQKYLKY